MGSSNGDEGDFSITVDETNTGIPANDLCTNPTPITIATNCVFQTVNGTTLNACPESITNCGFNNNPTVWYSVVLPANGIGFSFQNLSAGLNIGVFDNACPPASIFGPCIAANSDANGLTPGTYLIAVRNTNPGAPFNFDIKTNLSLPNDNPCQPGFTSTTLSNSTPLANQNNVCATTDNTCGGSAVQNTLWYSFTLTAPNDRITINVTGLTSPSIAIYSQANPCNATAINAECNGDGMVEFNCLPPGSYQIMVGTSTANAGNFTITATQGQNNAVVNELCTNATPLPGQPYPLCVNLGPFSTTNINACPEIIPFNVLGNCNILTEETSWYQFTAPGNPGDMPTMDFRFTSYTGTGTPFMALFNGGPAPGSCGTMTQLSNSCNSGLNVVFTHGPLVPGNTYFIAISSFGDTGGNFMFEVKFNLGPPNDDNCNIPAGYNLGANGTLVIVGTTPVSNSCAGADVVITECPSSSSESSVWFKFTVSPGSYGISINIRTTGGANDISGNVAAGAFLDGCTDQNPVSSVCFPVNTTTPLDCLAPGNYDLQISGPAANDGNFRIIIAQLADSRTCNGAPLMGDACLNAINVPLNVVCAPIPVSGCNNNACPETFNLSPCLYNQNPTIWYKFTIAPLVTSIDITNMTNGFNYGLLLGNPCVDNPVIGYNNFTCLNGSTANIPVTAGQTYYMLVSGTGTGGTFNFNIIQNVSPVNDDPNPSSPNPPYLLTIGGNHVSTTCCAIGFADDPNGDLQNVQCNNTTHDGAVWYKYVTGAERAIRIQVAPAGNAPITGNVTVEVVGGATQPGNTLFAPNSYYCGNVPATVTVGCYDPE
ncbi:MAG: hypothetical protein IPL08_14770 [Saprospiraceae bacterium]|nr:hypothetical protein [Saprospiraceae bacterium]